MQPDIQHWRELSALLDTLLALPDAEREAWIDTLPADQAAHAPELKRMLDAARELDVDEVILARPKMGEPTLAGVIAEHEAAAQEGAEFGPYRLLRPIGRGGMGVVWLAERSDGLLQRSVAIKLPVLSEGASRLIARFARERSILGALNHPHIARLYDAGVSADGQPYLVMEYVPGVSLVEYCDEARLSVAARLQLFLQVLSAVQHAHGLLIVHRDIKPSNILVTPEGEARLLDFGIAKLIGEHEFASSDLTQLTGRALTQHYASPEQVQEGAVGTGTDVYSLGVVLYQLLTGRRPYALKTESRTELEAAIVAVEPLRPASFRYTEDEAHARRTTPKALGKMLKGDLDAILLKALRKLPSERYLTAQSFADDIERYLRNDVVMAQPVSMRYRAGKFLARYTLPTSLAGLAAASLVVGSGVALWQAREAAAQARLAREEAANATALKDFMVGVLSAGSTNQAEANIARQRTTQQLLDAARDRVLADKQMTPEARIAVLVTLESIYATLYLHSDSRRLSKVALDVIRARGAKPADAEFFAQAAQNMLESAPDDALALLAEAEALATPSNPHTPDTQIGLHLARSQILADGKGLINEGVAELDRAVALRRRFPEPAELPLPRLLAYHAYTLALAGRFREAEQSAAEGARLVREDPSGVKLDGVGLERMLGSVLEEQLRIEAAEAAYERARVLGEEVGGESFPQALSARCNRARLIASASAEPRALEIALSAKQIADKGRGATDAFTAAEMWRCVAGVQLDLGDIKAARHSVNQLLLIDAQPFGAPAKLRHKLDARVAAAAGDRNQLTAALAKYTASGAPERPDSSNDLSILRAREAQLRNDAPSAKTLLAAVRVDPSTFSGLQESVESATLWRELGEPRRAAEIADAALAVIDKNPERQRLKALREKLLKLKG